MREGKVRAIDRGKGFSGTGEGLLHRLKAVFFTASELKKIALTAKSAVSQ